ncbi:MAG: hypothetical protein MJ252_27980 [archaeon]|nr:hypothetical protein [archaeon]
MDTKNCCIKCSLPGKNLIPFSCKHLICKRCFLRKILKRNILELPDKDNYTIHCKCKNGNTTMSLQKIADICKTKAEDEKLLCSKHNQEINKFCEECKQNFCETCLQSHNELFNKHHLIPGPKIYKNEKCEKHYKIYENYCRKCKAFICPDCLKEHESHELQSKQSFIDLFKENFEKLQFKSNDAFTQHIEKLEKNFDNEYNTNNNNALKAMEDTLNVLKKVLEDYKKKMEIKVNKKKLIMSIIKAVYGNYFEDLKKLNSTESNNFMLLKAMSKPINEFSELNYLSEFESTVTKLNSLKADLEKIDIANEIKFSYSFFSRKELNIYKEMKNAHKMTINSILELKDGRIVSAGEDNAIKIFDLEGNCQYILNAHISGVRSLCLLKDDRFASGSADKTVRVWDINTLKTLNLLQDHTGPVICLTQLDKEMFASCSFREIFIYDKSFKLKYNLTEHTNWIRNFIQVDSKKYVSSSDDCLIKVWDKHFRCLTTLKDHNAPVVSLFKLRDLRMLSGDRNGNVIVWSKAYNIIKTIKVPSTVLSMKQIQDGRIVFAMETPLIKNPKEEKKEEHSNIRLYELDIKSYTEFPGFKMTVNNICLLRNGGFGACGENKNITLWK